MDALPEQFACKKISYLLMGVMPGNAGIPGILI